MRSAPPDAMRTLAISLRLGCDPDVAHHRAVLLRKAGEIQRRAAAAVEMRGHAEQGTDGDKLRCRRYR